MNNKYLNFLNWAVFTMIDRKTQDDHKSKIQVCGLFRIPVLDEDGDKKEKLSNPGWLIWSTWEDGAGVVVPRDDGKLVLLTGWQSNLAYC